MSLLIIVVFKKTKTGITFLKILIKSKFKTFILEEIGIIQNLHAFF